MILDELKKVTEVYIKTTGREPRVANMNMRTLFDMIGEAVRPDQVEDWAYRLVINKDGGYTVMGMRVDIRMDLPYGKIIVGDGEE